MNYKELPPSKVIVTQIGDTSKLCAETLDYNIKRCAINQTALMEEVTKDYLYLRQSLELKNLAEQYFTERGCYGLIFVNSSGVRLAWLLHM